jgi:hypothetical protein
MDGEPNLLNHEELGVAIYSNNKIAIRRNRSNAHGSHERFVG